MENRAAYLAVGTFIVAFVLGMVALVLWLGKVEYGRKSHYYDIYVEGSVTGLSEGEQVRYRGVPIGTVKSIRIDRRNLQLVKITIDVNNSNLIREDAVASLESSGITGVAYVQINGGSLSKPPLRAKRSEKYPVIPSKPSRLEEVFQRAPKLLEKADAVMESLNQVLNPKNREALANILSNLELASSKLDALLVSVNKAIGSVDGTMAKVQKDLPLALQQFKKTAAGVEQIVQTFHNFLELNQGAVTNFTTVGLSGLTQLIADGQEVLEDVSKASQKVESSLKRLIEKENEHGREVR